VPPTAIAPANPAAFAIYKSADLGFVLRYPSAWQKDETATPAAFLAAFLAPPEGPASPFRENVVFSIQALLAPVAPDAFAQFCLRAQGQIQILSSAPGDIPAVQLVYAGSLNPQFMLPGKVLAVFAVKGTRGYMFSYTARADSFDRYLPAVQDMLSSVNVL
jgi:hypothetical protein